MKKIKVVSPKNIEIFDVPEPEVIAGDDVKIKVAYCGICFDDLPFFHQNNDMLAWGSILFPTGHEMTGYIVSCGQEAKALGFKEGDRVSGYAWKPCGHCYYCRSGKEAHCLNLKRSQGSMGEYIVWNAQQLIKLPDSISMKAGCLTDPIGYALNGMDRANIKIGNKVMVIGATVPGLIILQMVKMQGGTCLTAVDQTEANRELAHQFGAEYSLDANAPDLVATANLYTDFLGYDTIFETSGDINMLRLSPKMLAREGTIAFSSIYGLGINIPITTAELYLKEATLKPFYMAPYMLPRIHETMKRLDLESIISKVYPLDEADKAFEAADSRIYPKVLIEFAGEKA